MLHLGSVILAAALLGVPRALQGRGLGDPRAVWVDVAPLAPELADFAEELKRAIEGSAVGLATHPSRATTVIEIRSAATVETASGRTLEAVTVVVREGPSVRPVILDYEPGRRARAASRLVERLSA